MIAKSSKLKNGARIARCGPALLVVMLLVATGCGSDESKGAAATGDNSNSPALQDAQSAVDKATDTPTWEAAGPPIDVGDKLRGKRIFWLTGFKSLPFWQQQFLGMQAALDAAGVELTTADPKGDIGQAARMMQGAIERGYDLIMTGNETPQELAEPIRAAKAAGIPVNCMLARDPGPLTTEEKDIGCAAVVTTNYTAIGELGADATFAMSKGDEGTSALVFNASGGSGVADLETNGYVNRLKELCPSCKVDKADAPPATWATNLQSLTTSNLTKDPNLDWLFPIYGGMVPFILPAVNASGHDDLSIGTQEGGAVEIQQIQAGDLNFTISAPLEWFGLATADVAFRLLLGKPAPDDVKLPLHLYTKENVGDIDPNEKPPDEATWMNYDYRTPYFEHWGLSAPAQD